MPHTPVSCHTLPYQKHLAKLISTRYATLLQRAAFTPATASFSAAAAASSSTAGGAGAAAGAGDDAAVTAIGRAHALLVDRRVRVEGLAERPELNGCFGTVLLYDAARGQYCVAIEGGVPVLLRPDNLAAVPTKDQTCAARAAAGEQHRLDVGMTSPEAHRLAVRCHHGSNHPFPPTCTPPAPHLHPTSYTLLHPDNVRALAPPSARLTGAITTTIAPEDSHLPTTNTHTWTRTCHAGGRRSAALLNSPTHPLIHLHLLTYSLTYTYSLTHLLTYSLTHLLTYSPTHLLTYSLTHLLTYSLRWPKVCSSCVRASQPRRRRAARMARAARRRVRAAVRQRRW